MTKENLYTELKDATGKLLEMARNESWNSISTKCQYIISEIKDYDGKNIFERRKARKRENERKKPQPLNQIVANLINLYENLYDVNLYVYKSTSSLTIVEVQYYPKSSLDKAYFEKVKENKPMLHCKVVVPPYSKDNKSKFDINWELGGLQHNWKLYWWKKKTKRELNKK